ncbi:ArsR/SmtB family transcription factor [Mangrovihabitans endophyticus]|nr:helix-turn-helix domain-containing protein [Mangrovihabitans endophyticus]
MARTRLATRPDPLWELIASLHRLQTRRGYSSYEGWHVRVRRDLERAGLTAMVRTQLLPLVPLGGYFPDFLTPGPVDDLDEGIDLLLDTDPARIRRELGRMAQPPGTTGWLGDLAAARSRALHELGAALRAYFAVAVAPYWDEVTRTVAAERAVRGAVVLDRGLGWALEDVGPLARWKPPVLAVDGYPRDGDLHLGGRGLTLVPSYFCWRDPVTLADPELTPTLSYPAHRQRVNLMPARNGGPGRSGGDGQLDGGRGLGAPGTRLGPLIGTTRLRVLLATTHGATTGELARRVGISPATASHHATILRGAGLIDSRRQDNCVVHQLAPAGARLLEANS